MTRKILHLDLDAFFCSVEERLDPALVRKPFVVGGRPSGRGVVASCSYPARRYGVRSAMPTIRAQRLCPDLVVVPPHFSAYREASMQVMAVLEDVTPLVEQISIDEAFLDISDLPDPPGDMAVELQQRIDNCFHLPCSLGVATNKLVAKIANNVGKASGPGDRPPCSIKVIPPGAEASFLAPLAVEELWGIGPKTAERLHNIGVSTIGDLAARSPEDLSRLLGRVGLAVSRRAGGIDDRPVEGLRQVKSISEELTFASDVSDATVLMRTLRRLSDDVGFRLRSKNLAGSTIRLKLRWADFTTISRQVTLDQPTDLDSDIYAQSLRLFRGAWQSNHRVRLLGVGVAGLTESGYQLDLWHQEEQAKARRLQSALDRLRKRFGHETIFRGGSLEDN